MHTVRLKALLILGLGLLFAPAAQASLATYYVSLDTAAGSNQGHLTFLRAHSDHFHRLGPFGAAPGRIPEGYIGGKVYLTPGEGAFANRFVSNPYHLEGDGGLQAEYSDFEMRPIATLSGFPTGSPESILLNGGLRYTGSLVGTSVAIELVSISPGLGVADRSTGATIVPNVGDRHVLGAGDSFAAFTPLFFTDTFSPIGASYSATFRLVDVNGLVPASGLFTYELQSVPEPGTIATAAVGVASSALALRRRRHAKVSE